MRNRKNAHELGVRTIRYIGHIPFVAGRYNAGLSEMAREHAVARSYMSSQHAMSKSPTTNLLLTKCPVLTFFTHGRVEVRECFFVEIPKIQEGIAITASGWHIL
jgi:hypothetical protein